MEKIDARTLKDEAPAQIAQVKELSDTAVKKIIRLYETGGAAGLKPGRRGRCAGDKRSLSEEQELRLQELICDKRPEQVKMDSGLWNRGAASHLIKPECGISMPIRTGGRHFGDLPRRSRSDVLTNNTRRQ